MYNMDTVRSVYLRNWNSELEMTQVDHIPVTSLKRKRDFSIVVVNIAGMDCPSSLEFCKTTGGAADEGAS